MRLEYRLKYWLSIGLSLGLGVSLCLSRIADASYFADKSAFCSESDSRFGLPLDSN